jgi:hypothetical protein
MWLRRKFRWGAAPTEVILFKSGHWMDQKILPHLGLEPKDESEPLRLGLVSRAQDVAAESKFPCVI